MKAINREEFLKLALSSGLILTVPELLWASSDSDREPYEREDALGEKALSESLAPILKAIRIGISAPNPHNTQAWKFKILNDTSALLYVDASRLLKDTDPPARQIHIGQGTFLETLSIGASRLGHTAAISLFPEGKYSAADFGKKPVAKIILQKSNSTALDPLADFVSERRTVRSLYSGDDLSQEDFHKIVTDAGARYSEFKFLPKEGSEKLRKQLVSAMAVETYAYKQYEESRIWFRYSDKEIAEFKDGISMRGFGLSGIKYWFASRFILTPGKEVWHSEENQKSGLDIFADQIESSKGFIYLKTKKNEIIDWIQAGRDYARLHLAAVKNGFALHPLSQILQEFPEMDSLRKELDADQKVLPGEKIQMLVRLGRSDYRYFSPRRNLDRFILADKK